MKKLIKLDFNNTTRERKTEDSYSELYSHDKNNGSFEFEILNDTLTTEQVIALFKFTESNKIWKTTGTVEGNKVKVTFDTSLISQNETVICYLYFDEEQRTSDTFRFKFKVKVSEIDKMSRYEVKERFINNTVIVDRLDVVTKDELKEALKNVGGIATEGLLTEVKAEELFVKKTDAVDNTNFELVKNRVLALELKTDKDTVYDDSELKGRISVLEAKEDNNTIYDDTNVRERLTALESKPNIDISNLATKEELQEVRNSQPTVDTSHLVTKDELTAKNFLTEHQSLDNLVTKQELEEKQYLTTHQDLSEYAKKSELYNDSDLKARVEVLEQKTDKDTVYDDTPLKERVTALESKAIEGGVYDDKPIRDRLDVLEAKHDNDTIYDDTEVKRRLTEIESKPTVDTSVFVTEEKLAEKGYLTQHQSLENVVTKEELNNKGYLTSHQDISNLATKEELANVVTKEELNNKHYVTEEELNNKAYLTSHQDLSNYALKSEIPQPYNDSTLNERVTALESKAIEGGVYDDSDLRNRVVALESKEDKDTKYDDTDLKNRVTNLENKPPLDTSEFVTNQALESKGYIKDVSSLVTKDELENKHFLTEHQDLSSLVTKQELENKHYLTEHQNISHLVSKDELETKGYLTQHQSLEEYAKKSELYNDTDIKQRLTTLENKPNIDTSNFVTNEQLEGKHYLTEHQSLTHLATTSDLEALRNIVVSKAELSKKLDTTEYNSFKDSVVTKTELAEKGYLTTHQDISNLATKQEVEDTYAKKTDLPTPYNDSALVQKIGQLEARVDKYNDEPIKQRLTALESKPTVDTSSLVTKDELNTLKPNQTLSLNNGTLSISGGNSVALPVSRYEIHGSGMPNGVVEAEIGTTYVDKNKTNGAFKWIKTTDGGNQGWEVLTGDTGWRRLNISSKLTTASLHIRRVNNMVTYQFGGLDWGWFGIVRRGGAGYNAQPTDLERNCYILNHNQIPEGFRTPNSLIGPIYNDNGVPYGTWYIGNTADANHLRFQFLNPVPTDRDIRDIRVSNISYFTDDPWPTQLP